MNQEQRNYIFSAIGGDYVKFAQSLTMPPDEYARQSTTNSARFAMLYDDIEQIYNRHDAYFCIMSYLQINNYAKEREKMVNLSDLIKPPLKQNCADCSKLENVINVLENKQKEIFTECDDLKKSMTILEHELEKKTAQCATLEAKIIELKSQPKDNASMKMISIIKQAIVDYETSTATTKPYSQMNIRPTLPFVGMPIEAPPVINYHDLPTNSNSPVMFKPPYATIKPDHSELQDKFDHFKINEARAVSPHLSGSTHKNIDDKIRNIERYFVGRHDNEIYQLTDLDISFIVNECKEHCATIAELSGVSKENYGPYLSCAQKMRMIVQDIIASRKRSPVRYSIKDFLNIVKNAIESDEQNYNI